ncbi:Uncharacterised protein [Achromobacter sp. 2789STDY5608621]|nr:Uncharacterised protein [Achromobacter sp. 2789STDY5608621]
MSVQRFYSPSQAGFYTLEWHGGMMPADVVELAPGEFERWGDTGGEIAGVSLDGVLVMAQPQAPRPALP